MQAASGSLDQIGWHFAAKLAELRSQGTDHIGIGDGAVFVVCRHGRGQDRVANIAAA